MLPIPIFVRELFKSYSSFMVIRGSLTSTWKWKKEIKHTFTEFWLPRINDYIHFVDSCWFFYLLPFVVKPYLQDLIMELFRLFIPFSVGYAGLFGGFRNSGWYSKRWSPRFGYKYIHIYETLILWSRWKKIEKKMFCFPIEI